MQYPADSFITYCLISCFLLLGALSLCTHFKREIQQTFVCIETIIKHTYFSIMCIFGTSYGLYILWKELLQLQPHDQQHKQLKTDYSLVQILPLHEEFITEVREQLIQPPFMEQTTSFWDSQQDFQVFDIEYSLNLQIPNVSMERIHSPPVVHNDRAFTEFVKGEERCLKFVNQDLTFLQASHIPLTFSNVSYAPTQLEIHHAQNEPKLTVQQLLETEYCKDYIKTQLQTLDGVYVTQPKRFLPLAQEAKKLVEKFQKEEIASQWAGLPPEKLLLESFVEHLMLFKA